MTASIEHPISAWRTLRTPTPNTTQSVAACVDAANTIIEAIDRYMPHPGGLVLTAEMWARIGLAAVRSLVTSGAFAHLDSPEPLRCLADEDRLRSWLNAPSDLPGFSELSFAETWDIDEDFIWDADGIGARMATLVEQAQHTGVYGLPGYTITLRQVTTDDPDADPIVEHQVTLHTPSGALLASAPIPADHLAENLSGVDAAIAVLTNTATVVNELLIDEWHLATAPRSPAARPHRGFTPLDLTPSVQTPAPVETTPAARTDRQPHR